VSEAARDASDGAPAFWTAREQEAPADGKVKQTAGAPRTRCDEKMCSCIL
jgi:hypothetical protein